MSKESMLVPLTLAPIAATMIAWKDISYVVVAAVALVCTMLYSYYLAVIDRFVLIQLAVSERLVVLGYDEFSRVLEKEHALAGVIGLRVTALVLLSGLWMLLILLKSITDPVSVREALPGFLAPGWCACILFGVCVVLLFWARARYGNLFRNANARIQAHRHTRLISMAGHQGAQNAAG